MRIDSTAKNAPRDARRFESFRACGGAMDLSRMDVDDLLHPLHSDFEFTGKGFHCLPLCVLGADQVVPFGFG